ncbi:hypothetical protein [Gordonia sp. NPDC003429]
MVAAVGAVPGVTGLYAGAFGEIATYLPGGRVGGITLSDNAGEVHIVVDMAHDLRAVAEQAADAASAVAGVPVSVVVEDISVGGAATQEPEETQQPEQTQQPEEEQPSTGVKNDG